MIAIIDYRAGNLTSVKLAFENLGTAAKITNRPKEILSASRVVFPGDGAAASAMDNLRGLGLLPVIHEVYRSGIPFLGICLGTQIILEQSDENNGVPCVGLIPGQVRRFIPQNPREKVPHMGWNSVHFKQAHSIFAGIEDESEFYFIHSYFPCPRPEDVLGETEYSGSRFASVLGHGNMVATQFHPERSGRIGLQLLKNFSQWKGSC